MINGYGALNTTCPHPWPTKSAHNPDFSIITILINMSVEVLLPYIFISVNISYSTKDIMKRWQIVIFSPKMKYWIFSQIYCTLTITMQNIHHSLNPNSTNKLCNQIISLLVLIIVQILIQILQSKQRWHSSNDIQISFFEWMGWIG